MTRVNWLAIIVSGFVMFLFGGLWYDVLFRQMWLDAMSPMHTQMASGGTPYPYVVSVVMSFATAYAIARMFSWRGPVGIGRGAFIAFSMALLIFGSMTWVDYAFSGLGMTIGWINVGFVAIGMTMQGLILAAWRAKRA
jgi:hypothetical protein